MRRRLETFLAAPRLPLYLALVAIALLAPALGAGWQLDDHYHRVVLTGEGLAGMTPWQVFSGPPPDPTLHAEFVDLGVFPWWVSDGFRLSLLRPLSVATMRLDFTLWPDSPALMHAHNLIWFGLLIAAATLLYRRLMAPAWLAGLAALLYALDDAHAGPAAWIANRNALIACLFGVLCLIAHDRWRRRGDRLAAILAPACLAAGLAGGEAALATAGYLLAYACHLEPGSWRRRIGSLVPTGVVLTAWAAFYKLGGYGATGSGMYLDPVGDPLRYAIAVVRRVPILLMGQWSPLPADLAPFLPPERQLALWALAAGVIALVATLVWPLVRRHRASRFWATGMLLSLAPIAAVFPSNRLLFFVGLGAAPLLAESMVGVWKGASWLPGSRTWRRLAKPAVVLLAVVHLPLSFVLMPVGALSVAATGAPIDRAAETLPNDDAIREQELVLVNAPDHLLYVTNIPTYQLLADRPLPRRVRALSTGPTPISVTRTGTKSLRLEIERGLFAGPLGLLFRDPSDELAVGSSIEVPGLQATVVAVDERGAPVVVRYDFPTELEDPARRWLHFADGAWRLFELPDVGQTWRLAAPTGPLDFLY